MDKPKTEIVRPNKFRMSISSLTRDRKYRIALISRYKKLSRNPIDDQRNTVGINDMAIMAVLNTWSSRPLSFAIFTNKKVASADYPIAKRRIANKSVNSK